MTDPQFEKKSKIRKPVDPALIEWLNKSYQDGEDIEISRGDCPEVRDYIRQAIRYAKSTGTALAYRFEKRDDKEYTMMRLRPKRVYAKKNPEYWGV